MDSTKDWGKLTPTDDRGAPSLLSEAMGTVVQARSTMWVWTPPDDLPNPLPRGLCLPIRIHVGADGIRYISAVGPKERPKGTPAGGLAGLVVAVMGEAGLAMRERDGDLSPENIFRHRLAFLAIQRARRTKEFCLRKFNSPKDLRIAGSGGSSNHTLVDGLYPLYGPGLGRDPIETLLDAGRNDAREAGIDDPSYGQSISYGFAAHARSNPGPPVANVSDLIRSVVFGVGFESNPEDAVSEAVVVERLCDALGRHLEKPAARYNGWFSGRGSSLVKQIGGRKKARGGILKGPMVRRALIQLGWNAHGYVAECVGYLMLAVAKALPVPLSLRERRIFEGMHLPQPHFGGLPMILLVDRFQFLEGSLGNLCENPGDSDHVRVLHQVMQSYVDLNSERRRLDCEIKRPATLVFDEKRDAAPEPIVDRLALIVMRILESRGLGCGCSTPSPKATVDDPERDPITITYACLNPGCEFIIPLITDRAEIGAVGRVVLGVGGEQPDDD
ncbi:hypothetical protein [Paludisphaera mucosa]|uniref:Uncharacterized protein n=1 Tax=Paludisphaera mucosa TaxID=3030827 RepID=A0ABT6FE88_9BACT|nr:hypothetical protein [Paludisphaera mucosa]MDG3005901.1 hypothetical protein [Paludisphaera mucosa]